MFYFLSFELLLVGGILWNIGSGFTKLLADKFVKSHVCTKPQNCGQVCISFLVGLVVFG